MGAKQSKRSVDISGKEAEGASEVAAAGAGGEGRLEAIADADSLKPQLNGDAQHIQPPDEKTVSQGALTASPNWRPLLRDLKHAGIEGNFEVKQQFPSYFREVLPWNDSLYSCSRALPIASLLLLDTLLLTPIFPSMYE